MYFLKLFDVHLWSRRVYEKNATRLGIEVFSASTNTEGGLPQILSSKRQFLRER